MEIVEKNIFSGKKNKIVAGKIYGLHQHANRKKIEDPHVGSEPTLSTPNLQWC